MADIEVKIVDNLAIELDLLGYSSAAEWGGIGGVLSNQADLQSALNLKGEADAVALNTTHRGLTDNPHGVTTLQLGLENVDNTSDVNKPISTLQQSALDNKEPASDAILKNDEAIDCNGQELQNFEAEIDTKTDSYTLTDSDRGKIITVDNAASKIITVPDSLSAGFSCTVIQIGAGDVTFTAFGSMVVHNRNSYTKTAGQYAAVSLAVYASNNCITQGDMA